MVTSGAQLLSDLFDAYDSRLPPFENTGYPTPVEHVPPEWLIGIASADRSPREVLKTFRIARCLGTGQLTSTAALKANVEAWKQSHAWPPSSYTYYGLPTRAAKGDSTKLRQSVSAAFPDLRVGSGVGASGTVWVELSEQLPKPRFMLRLGFRRAGDYIVHSEFVFPRYSPLYEARSVHLDSLTGTAIWKMHDLRQPEDLIDRATVVGSDVIIPARHVHLIEAVRGFLLSSLQDIHEP